MLVELGIAGQPFPIGPLRGAGNLLGGLDGFPLRRCHHSDKTPFHNDLRVRELLLIRLTRGDKRGPERLRMNHSRMQHPGQPHIGRPRFFRRHFRTDDGILERLADDCVLTHRLHRRIAFDRQAHDAGEVSRNGDREPQLLILDEIAI